MKILYKNMGFGGGAPRSLLEYARIADAYGHEVLAVGQMTYEPDFYNEAGIPTYDMPYFIISNPIKNIRIITKYMRFIKEQKPDLIQVITTDQSVMQKVVSLALDIPTIYTVPGGLVDKGFAKSMHGENLIAFSEENREELIAYGCKEANINVISNRIHFGESLNQDTSIYNRTTETVKLLFIGRLATNQYGIRCVMALTEYLHRKGRSIELTVLGDGEDLKAYQDMGEKMNQRLGRKVVEFKGYETNVPEYISKAHICFGKGRSILGAISQNRLSYVSSETEKLFPVEAKTVKELSIHNFSGRKTFGEVDFDHVEQQVINVLEGKVDVTRLAAANKVMRQSYDIMLMKDRILKMYNDEVLLHEPSSLLSRILNASIQFLRCYSYYIYHSIQRKLGWIKKYSKGKLWQKYCL